MDKFLAAILGRTQYTAFQEWMAKSQPPAAAAAATAAAPHPAQLAPPMQAPSALAAVPPVPVAAAAAAAAEEEEYDDDFWAELDGVVAAAQQAGGGAAASGGSAAPALSSALLGEAGARSLPPGGSTGLADCEIDSPDSQMIERMVENDAIEAADDRSGWQEPPLPLITSAAAMLPHLPPMPATQAAGWATGAPPAFAAAAHKPMDRHFPPRVPHSSKASAQAPPASDHPVTVASPFSSALTGSSRAPMAASIMHQLQATPAPAAPLSFYDMLAAQVAPSEAPPSAQRSIGAPQQQRGQRTPASLPWHQLHPQHNHQHSHQRPQPLRQSFAASAYNAGGPLCGSPGGDSGFEGDEDSQCITLVDHDDAFDDNAADSWAYGGDASAAPTVSVSFAGAAAAGASRPDPGHLFYYESQQQPADGFWQPPPVAAVPNNACWPPPAAPGNRQPASPPPVATDAWPAAAPEAAPRKPRLKEAARHKGVPEPMPPARRLLPDWSDEEDNLMVECIVHEECCDSGAQSQATNGLSDSPVRPRQRRQRQDERGATSSSPGGDDSAAMASAEKPRAASPHPSICASMAVSDDDPDNGNADRAVHSGAALQAGAGADWGDDDWGADCAVVFEDADCQPEDSWALGGSVLTGSALDDGGVSTLLRGGATASGAAGSAAGASRRRLRDALCDALVAQQLQAAAERSGSDLRAAMGRLADAINTGACRHAAGVTDAEMGSKRVAKGSREQCGLPFAGLTAAVAATAISAAEEAAGGQARKPQAAPPSSQRLFVALMHLAHQHNTALVRCGGNASNANNSANGADGAPGASPWLQRAVPLLVAGSQAADGGMESFTTALAPLDGTIRILVQDRHT